MPDSYQDIGFDPEAQDVSILAPSGYVEPVEEEEEYLHPLLDNLEQGNIVDQLKDNEKCASDIIQGCDDAYQTMAPWKKKYDEALKLAKLQPKSEHKTFPFDGASTAMLPYVMEAMLDFNARSAPELAFAKSIVSAKIYGKKDDAKEERAKRVAVYSNYQLTEGMPDWRDEQDKNLMALPCVGTSYKKTYWDRDTQEVRSDLCLADEIIFDHDYKSFDSAPDKYEKTNYSKNELITYIRGSQEWDIKEDDIDDDEDEEFVEAYTWEDLDDDGLEEPYFIIVWPKKNRCVYMRPLYDEDTLTLKGKKVIKVEMVKLFTQYRFMPDPEGGPMGMGWGILLGSMFKALNTSLRQQIDAGTLSVTASNSGLINADTTSKRGNSVQSGPIKVKMGELTPVHTRGTGSLSQNIAQFPFAGPSPAMFQLLGFLSDTTREMISVATTIESNAGESASLYLARLQQGLKRPNVIIMRVYRAAQFEFNNIFVLNNKNSSDEKYNKVLDEDKAYSMKADFNSKDCDISLVADPSQGSDMERAARSSAILERAEMGGNIISLREATIDWLKSMQTPEDRIEVLTPEPQGPDPMEQLLMAQQASDVEFKNREMIIRERKLALDQSKQALDATKEMMKLGLETDKTEAEITKLYTEAMKNMAEAGIAEAEHSMNVIADLEQRFINNAEGGINGLSASNPNPTRPLA